MVPLPDDDNSDEEGASIRASRKQSRRVVDVRTLELLKVPTDPPSSSAPSAAPMGRCYPPLFCSICHAPQLSPSFDQINGASTSDGWAVGGVFPGPFPPPPAPWNIAPSWQVVRCSVILQFSHSSHRATIFADFFPGFILNLLSSGHPSLFWPTPVRSPPPPSSGTQPRSTHLPAALGPGGFSKMLDFFAPIFKPHPVGVLPGTSSLGPSRGRGWVKRAYPESLSLSMKKLLVRITYFVFIFFQPWDPLPSSTFMICMT